MYPRVLAKGHPIVYIQLSLSEYLIKVGQTIGILAKTLILSSESVTSSYLSELLQIYHIESTKNR